MITGEIAESSMAFTTGIAKVGEGINFYKFVTLCYTGRLRLELSYALLSYATWSYPC